MGTPRGSGILPSTNRAVAHRPSGCSAKHIRGRTPPPLTSPKSVAIPESVRSTPPEGVAKRPPGPLSLTCSRDCCRVPTAAPCLQACHQSVLPPPFYRTDHRPAFGVELRRRASEDARLHRARRSSGARLGRSPEEGSTSVLWAIRPGVVDGSGAGGAGALVWRALLRLVVSAPGASAPRFRPDRPRSRAGSLRRIPARAHVLAAAH